MAMGTRSLLACFTMCHLCCMALFSGFMLSSYKKGIRWNGSPETAFRASIALSLFLIQHPTLFLCTRVVISVGFWIMSFLVRLFVRE